MNPADSLHHENTLESIRREEMYNVVTTASNLFMQGLWPDILLTITNNQIKARRRAIQYNEQEALIRKKKVLLDKRDILLKQLAKFDSGKKQPTAPVNIYRNLATPIVKKRRMDTTWVKPTNFMLSVINTHYLEPSNVGLATLKGDAAPPSNLEYVHKR
jgi:hypothetical protein